jgi:RNA-directed DNA polymerase
MTKAPEPKDKLDAAATAVVANGPEGEPLGWHDIDWRAAEGSVRRLRQRIFTASQAGDLKRVRNLQKLMLRSRATALVSVRRGDGAQRRPLDGGHRRRGRAHPGGQAGFGPPGAARRRAASSPAGQAGLCPEAGQWQAAPARHSGDHGSRAASARSQRAGARVGGAVRAEVLRLSAGPRLPRRDRGRLPGVKGKNPRRRWVLDADLAAAFDRIAHDHILAMLGSFPARGTVKQWRASVVEEGRLTRTEEGTPQGGVAIPLLLNIALHGMEGAAGVRYGRNVAVDDRPQSPREWERWLATDRKAIVKVALRDGTSDTAELRLIHTACHTRQRAGNGSGPVMQDAFEPSGLA